jgi:hypothetical protein
VVHQLRAVDTLNSRVLSKVSSGFSKATAIGCNFIMQHDVFRKGFNGSLRSLDVEFNFPIKVLWSLLLFREVSF